MGFRVYRLYRAYRVSRAEGAFWVYGLSRICGVYRASGV